MDAITALGRDSIFIQTDVSDEESVKAMTERALAYFGRVDVLVNNAGIFTESLLENLSVADWDRVLGVNLRGTFLCSRYLIGQMLERGSGRIINIASQLGQIGGTYVGEQGTVAAGNQAGGNWIYGGPNAEIGMLASGVVKDAGYNLATGIAAMTIRLKQ